MRGCEARARTLHGQAGAGVVLMGQARAIIAEAIRHRLKGWQGVGREWHGKSPTFVHGGGGGCGCGMGNALGAKEAMRTHVRGRATARVGVGRGRGRRRCACRRDARGLQGTAQGLQGVVRGLQGTAQGL